MTPQLTDAQTRLLEDLVTAARASSERFMMLRTAYAVWLQHPGFADGRLRTEFEDVEALREAGLVRIDPHGGNYGGYHFFTTPAAKRTCEEDPGRQQSPAVRVAPLLEDPPVGSG